LFPSAQSVCVCVCVCEGVVLCEGVHESARVGFYIRCREVKGRIRPPALSPPDVRGFGVFGSGSGLGALAAGPLAAVAQVSVEARLGGFLLVALPRRARVLRFGVGGQGAALVVVHGGGGRSEGGAEAQAVAQSPPVLLALQPDAPGQRLLHLLAAAQEDIHQLHVRPEAQRGSERVA